MAGYLVFQQDVRVTVNPIRLGLFDLVREFEQDPFPFHSPQRLTLTGLDDLLVLMNATEEMTEPRTIPLLLEMRRKLARAANEVARLGDIHVPIRLEMHCGAEDKLYVKFRMMTKRIPLWQLFGCHPTIREVEGRQCFHFGVTLS